MVLAGCVSDTPSDPDAAPTDAALTDAAVTDALAPDAGVPCPGALLFTGGYEDWDSTDASFDGVEFAQVSQADDSANAAETAPNGRVMMCLPARRTAVDFRQPDYLDLRYVATPGNLALPFDIRGLTPLRADDLFVGELGVARDEQAGYGLVAVRVEPGGEPLIGARVQLGNAHAGAFVSDGAGVYGADDTLAAGPFVLFANVAVSGDQGDGQSSVQVTPPDGYQCQGPGTIDVRAGALAATTFVCTGL
jgi:hypothetical protein